MIDLFGSFKQAGSDGIAILSMAYGALLHTLLENTQTHVTWMDGLLLNISSSDSSTFAHGARVFALRFRTMLAIKEAAAAE